MNGWLVRRNGSLTAAEVPVLYRGRWVLLDDSGGVAPIEGGAVIHCDGCGRTPLRPDWSVPDDGTHWCPNCANNDPTEGAAS